MDIKNFADVFHKERIKFVILLEILIKMMKILTKSSSAHDPD